MKKILTFLLAISISFVGYSKTLMVNITSPSEGSSSIKPPKKRVFCDTLTTIKLKSKKAFTLKLKSNPSTGYSWSLVEDLDKEKIFLKSNSYVADEPVRPGSGGFEYWTFKPKTKGTITIKLTYSRSVGKGEPKLYTIEIE